MWSEVAWGIAIQVLSTGECRFCGFLEEGEGNKLRKVDTWLAGCGRVELGHKQCAMCESCYSNGRVKREGGRG